MSCLCPESSWELDHEPRALLDPADMALINTNKPLAGSRKAVGDLAASSFLRSVMDLRPDHVMRISTPADGNRLPADKNNSKLIDPLRKLW